MTALAVAIAVCMGLAIGSFLNVVISRIPRGESIIHPASACPQCSSRIRPRDNIPILSWVLLRGRCRDCGQPISVIYPTVEVITGLFFGLIVWTSATTSPWGSVQDTVSSAAACLAFLWLAAASVALIVLDFTLGRLPNAIVGPLYIVGVVFLAGASLVDSDIEALARAGIGLVSLGGAYALLFAFVPGGMGWGDVKLAGILGMYLAWVGWGALIVGAFAAFFLGGGVGLCLLAIRRAKRDTAIVFGPWMLTGAWGGIVWGNYLWSCYLDAVGASGRGGS